MAKVYIAEHARMPSTLQGVAPGRVIAEQTVAIGVEAKSSAFNAATRVIRVHADAICSIAIGANPTATVNTRRISADQTEYWEVEQGDKISVITNT